MLDAASLRLYFASETKRLLKCFKAPGAGERPGSDSSLNVPGNTALVTSRRPGTVILKRMSFAHPPGPSGQSSNRRHRDSARPGLPGSRRKAVKALAHTGALGPDRGPVGGA